MSLLLAWQDSGGPLRAQHANKARHPELLLKRAHQNVPGFEHCDTVPWTPGLRLGVQKSVLDR